MIDKSPQHSLRQIPDPEKSAQAVVAEDRDGKAEAEAAAISQQTLEKTAQASEHGRRERFRNHVALGALVLMWIIILLITVAVLALAWHYLASEKYSWLSDGQLAKLQTFIFSGAVIGALNAYVRRNLV